MIRRTRSKRQGQQIEVLVQQMHTFSEGKLLFDMAWAVFCGINIKYRGQVYGIHL